MKFTILIQCGDDVTTPMVIGQIERTDPLQASALGLTLSESKRLLSRIQQEIVQAQIRHHAESQRICPQCGVRRALKDHRKACFKSLFGSVKLMIPRLFECGCDGVDPGARTLRLEGMVNWVAPELEYIQSHLAATVPYACASKLLALLLPIDANNAVSTVRRRALSVGRRLETELYEATVEDKPSSTHVDNCATISIGLDSGFIRDCRPQSERSFEVVVGRILGSDAGSRSIGFVRTLEDDERVRHRLRHRVAQQELTTEQMTVFTDGDAGLRCLQLAVLPNASHVLDWFHLTRHLTILKRVLHSEEAIEKVPTRYHEPLRKALESLKWRLWHGQYWRALRRLKEMLFTLRLPTIYSRRVAKRLRRHAKKLLEYLKHNADSLVNYGKRYRAGERISTSFIESTVNQLIDKRMSKSQQMRWSRYGAHLLLQVRADLVDGRLADNFLRWYPGFGRGTVGSSAT